jgi:hypothetical protein
MSRKLPDAVMPTAQLDDSSQCASASHIGNMLLVSLAPGGALLHPKTGLVAC